MGVTLPQLRALVTVVDRASFTDAAAKLGVSQSAVSHAVLGLEKEVGGRVLLREGGVELTVLGHRVVEHARSALASVSALESSVRKDEALAGIVRLGAVATVCQGLLPELLPLELPPSCRTSTCRSTRATTTRCRSGSRPES